MKIAHVSLILVALLGGALSGEARPIKRKAAKPAPKRNIRGRILDEDGLPPPPEGFPDCHVFAPEFIGDGWCDSEEPFNTAECGFDGGDCCEGTCVNGDYQCGVEAPFFCKDPTQPTTPPPDPPEGYPECVVTMPAWVGNGLCDPFGPYNTAECGYDGGDCCEGTCKDGDDNVCGDGGFFCQDPTQPTTPPVTTGPPTEHPNYPGCFIEIPTWVGDGLCDPFEPYNTAECGYDGGDCCEGTCQDGDFVCDEQLFFDCVDPTQPTSPPFTTGPPTEHPNYPGCFVEIHEFVGDSWCDSDGGYNTEECGFDGGDCCEATCVDNEEAETKCGENAPFDCKDPAHSGN